MKKNIQKFIGAIFTGLGCIGFLLGWFGDNHDLIKEGLLMMILGELTDLDIRIKSTPLS